MCLNERQSESLHREMRSTTLPVAELAYSLRGDTLQNNEQPEGGVLPHAARQVILHPN
jgi:hypothetical protein